MIGGFIIEGTENSGLAPSQPSECAIIATLQPGNYTAIVRGKNSIDPLRRAGRGAAFMTPGGVPLYKNGQLVGGLGVTGDGIPGPIPDFRAENPFIFIDGYDKDEDIALAGQHGYAPASAILATNVFINGIRLPYVNSSTVFSNTIVPPGNADSDGLAAPTAFRWFFERAPDVGNVHSGFANSLRDSWAESIRKLLKKAGAGTRRTLWITGHSLGGALAVLAGGACAYDPDTLLPVNGLYTFGQPRIGLHDFCNNIEIKFGRVYYRFVNDRDLVPRVPPRAFDYTHAGRLIHFDSNGQPDADSQSSGVFWRAPLARSARWWVISLAALN
jgi:hypothetical protein